MGHRLMWHIVGRPVMRMAIVIGTSIGWFIASSLWFFNYGPQFQVWEQLLTNYGTTDNNAWLFWTWIPILFMFVLGTMWASGVLGELRRALEHI